MSESFRPHLHAPRSLFRATLLLWCIPLGILLQFMAASRIPVYRWNPVHTATILLSGALLALVLSMSYLRGLRSAWRSTLFTATVWAGISIWLTWKRGNPNLAFFAVGVLVFWTPVLTKLRRESKKFSFYLPLRWYQGFPKPIPVIESTLLQNEQRVSVSVAYIDESGMIIYSRSIPQMLETHTLVVHPFEVEVLFRGKQVKIAAQLTRADSHGRCFNIEFLPRTPDQNKELKDLVELIRGEGYVE